MNDFQDFIVAAQQAAANLEEEETDLGEVPDEFLDPIMSTLMEDPVILPTSGQTVDRSVIARHLLSDAKDPFNRNPLTTDMLQPNVELKAKIDAFKKSRKGKKENTD